MSSVHTDASATLQAAGLSVEFDSSGLLGGVGPADIVQVECAVFQVVGDDVVELAYAPVTRPN